MWEMSTGKFPYGDMAQADIKMALKNGKAVQHLALPQHCDREWSDIIMSCLQQNPANRCEAK